MPDEKPDENAEERLLEGWRAEYGGADAAFRRQYDTALTKYGRAEEAYAALLNTAPPVFLEPSQLDVPRRAQRGLERAQYLHGLLVQYGEVKNRIKEAATKQQESVFDACSASNHPDGSAARAVAIQELSTVCDESDNLSGRLIMLEQTIRTAALAHLDPTYERS